MRKILLLTLIIITSELAFGQTDYLIPWAKTNRGNSLYTRFGIHNGNRIGLTFRSDGSISGTNANDIRGDWPYPATKDGYIGDVTPLVGIEIPIKDYNGDGKLDTLHSVTISPGPRSGQAAKTDPSDGHFQGFEPEPGYVKLSQDTVSMSHISSTWPSSWPDHPDWIDSTGKAVWDGYFGKGVIRADQESYFVMDDAMDTSPQQRTSKLFHPDSTDNSRNGMGLVVRVRGMQWSQIQAQDVLFWLYDISNIGTTNYNKVVFGEVVGGCVGDVGQNYNDCSDDLGYFDLNNNLTYTWDYDDKTSDPLWTSISTVLSGVRTNMGYAGYAYLESPGNGFDGIDNDNDAVDASSSAFQSGDFTYSSQLGTYTLARTLHRNDAGTNTNWPANEIILIDPGTYNRTIVMLDTLLHTIYDTVYVSSLGQQYKIYDGAVLSEVVNNGLDDNLNGIIDENRELHYERIFKDSHGVVSKEEIRPLYYRNYFTGSGSSNTMIDERRDSGPGSVTSGWVPDYAQQADATTGKYPGTIKSHWSGDENGDWSRTKDDVGADGVADTKDIGEGDGMPTSGEPHFDKTDVNESDQIGLTSFNFFNQTASPPMNNNETLWNRMKPGYFDVISAQAQDGDFIYSSGYFPLLPNRTERFSLALVFGQDSAHIFKNKQIAQKIYNANYDFLKPPPKPILTVVPGDKKVTLIWDSKAEAYTSFQGYNIYRSTDAGFTEGDGSAIATYDLKDTVSGYFVPVTQDLAELPRFYLGSNSGLTHTYVDNNLQNGQGYFYAVTAFTSGDPNSNIYPAEDPKFITVSASGAVQRDVNTVFVTPRAVVAGYVGPNAPSLLGAAPGTETFGTGKVYLHVVNPLSVKNKTYRVNFASNVVNLVPTTTSYSVIDYTNSTLTDTLIKVTLSSNVQPGDDDKNVFDGVYLTVDNDWTVMYDTAKSGWNATHTKKDYTLSFTAAKIAGVVETGIAYPRDYNMVFDASISASDTSSALNVTQTSGSIYKIAKTTSNFRIYDAITGDPIKYAYLDAGLKGQFSSLDRIIFLQDTKTSAGQDTTIMSWLLQVVGADTSCYHPTAGDTLKLKVTKPYSSTDILQITTTAATVNKSLASAQLDKIRVVPNPYIATTTQEAALPATITTGRGTRKISFIHLPKSSSIYIYTSRGELVRKLVMPLGQQINDGSLDWDLTTSANLDVAYGVYFYMVDAPGVGQKFGKLAIIK
ncbi:MAG: hypothetical protein P4L45_16930 [Ignavibacteriaceae bacterium]|nr:hypothetical protein [Ignavibacteriaceae bacterium]